MLSSPLIRETLRNNIHHVHNMKKSSNKHQVRYIEVKMNIHQLCNIEISEEQMKHKKNKQKITKIYTQTKDHKNNYQGGVIQCILSRKDTI